MCIVFSLKILTISLCWETNCNGLIRNELNGPNFYDPLDIDESLSSVLCGIFFESNKRVDAESLTSKLILASDVWNKILKFL